MIAATAFLGHVTGVLTWIWTAVIAQTLYRIIINSQKQYQFNGRNWIILSLFIVLIHLVSLFFPVFRSEGTICTFNLSKAGELWRLFAIYIPQWVFILLTLYYYIKAHIEIKNTHLSIYHKITIKRLFIFSSLQFIVYIPLSIVRIVQYFTNDCFADFFYTLSFSLYTLHGLLSSIVYSLIFKVNCKELDSIDEDSDHRSFSSGSGVNLLLETID